MKIILLFVSLAIFLPLSAFATCNTDSPNNQLLRNVLDKDGNPLDKAGRYFLLPPHHTMVGGGISLANIANTTCPMSVVQSKDPMDDGIGVYITPMNPKHQNISESTPVNIHFYSDNPLAKCSNLTVWKVDNLAIIPDFTHTISTGAKLGDRNDVSSWFQIKPLGRSSYKLVFCPYLPCQNIGRIVDGIGNMRLVLTEEPKDFVFKLDGRIGKADV